jgi:predicted Zn-dependent protease
MALALVLSACAARIPPIGGGVFTPEPDEPRLWARADKDATVLLERVRRYDDAALLAHVTGLVERVTPDGVRAAGGPVPRVTVLRDPTLAAFALPDGRVFLHTGLLAAVERDDQLALVLARELAHVYRRHALTVWRDEAAPVRVVSVAALGPTAAAILGANLRVAALAAVTGYGEPLEAEADADAREAVARAGWDAREAAKVWAVLARELPGRGALETFLPGNPAWLEARGPTARPADTTGPSDPLDASRRALLRDNAADDLRRGRFALARRQLDRVLAAAPDDALAYLVYGDLHRLQAQQAPTPDARDAEVRQARARYTRALALDPTLAEAHRQLGLLAYQQQNLGRARAELEEYLRRVPAAPDAARIGEYVRELGR